MKKEVIKKIITDLESLMKNLKELIKDEEEEKVPKSKEVKLEDLRAVLATLSQHGKTAEVKELIVKFGRTKLSDVPKENYSQLLKEAEEIKID
ncbi:hypothetical protein [Streptococcus sp. HMSC073A12]|uniref:hypothetical protein n=1 Tax=Streptococcus sp. HMSC073A12 TaxID=1739380 RepID=UPI0008A244E1|nr:hypothetical protein [Streptococcus sp. HMSC073A12]OFR64335.1 hypothetical protein HMPREF2876_09650 [Streptococcus sp. HMSC073A12]